MNYRLTNGIGILSFDGDDGRISAIGEFENGAPNGFFTLIGSEEVVLIGNYIKHKYPKVKVDFIKPGEISQKRLGATAVIRNHKLQGIITDGDLRRMLEKENSFSNLLAKDIMCVNPIKMDINILAYDALKMMENNKINQIIVVDNKKYVGIVHIHQILKEGIL